MEIQESLADDVAILDVSGRLWGESEGERLSKLFNKLKTQGCCKVVVKMKHISMMNSSGLGSLIAGLKSFRDVGGDLKLAAVNERIMTILHITKLDQVFEIFDTEEEALQRFSGD